MGENIKPDLTVLEIISYLWNKFVQSCLNARGSTKEMFTNPYTFISVCCVLGSLYYIAKGTQKVYMDRKILNMKKN